MNDKQLEEMTQVKEATLRLQEISVQSKNLVFDLQDRLSDVMPDLLPKQECADKAVPAKYVPLAAKLHDAISEFAIVNAVMTNILQNCQL